MKTYLNFSTPMVQALLEGRKTQTRRPLKPQPHWVIAHPDDKPELINTGGTDPYYIWWAALGGDENNISWGEELVPLPNLLGDLLWVREAWWDRTDRLPAIHDLGTIHYVVDGWEPPEGINLHYKRPSVHMSRWASRITLRITDVRVERVQEISGEDIFADGVQIPVEASSGNYLLRVTGKTPPIRYEGSPAVKEFASLWDSIYGPGSWERNDWVWVRTFEVIKENIDEVTL